MSKKEFYFDNLLHIALIVEFSNENYDKLHFTETNDAFETKILNFNIKNFEYKVFLNHILINTEDAKEYFDLLLKLTNYYTKTNTTNNFIDSKTNNFIISQASNGHYAIKSINPSGIKVRNIRETDYIDFFTLPQVSDNKLIGFQCLLADSSLKAKLVKKSITNAIISAKGAIVGRNMSHNIGSHVLYYLRQHLSGDVMQMSELLKDIRIKEETNGNVILGIDDVFTKPINKTKLELPFLRGLGTFLTYLQERQDFIAALSSEYKPAFNSANFKSFVIDNLLKDLRAKRHSYKTESKQEVNILLKFIAKSEDTSIKITFNNEDMDVTKELGVTSELHGFSIDLPGSTLGRQAIYSILENIIRNAAKHGYRKDNSSELELDISIIKEGYEFTDLQDEFFKSDNEKNEWKQKYHQLVITDNNDNDKNLAKKLRQSIQSELIDERGKLIESEKGIKEVVISALWLNGLNITDVSSYERLRYIDVNVNKEKKLQYILYITKSKKVLFVSNKLKSQIEDTKKVYQKGFEEFTLVNYEDFQNNIEEVSRYNLIVDIDGKVDKKYFNKLRRYFKPPNDFISAHYDFYNTESVDLYSFIIDMFISNKEDELFLFFYQWFVKATYYQDNDFPNIVVNFKQTDSQAETNNDDNLGRNTNLKFFKNYFPDLDRTTNSLKNNQDIYYDRPIGDRKTIAFRRHIHTHIEEFFDQANSITFLKQTKSSGYLDVLNKTYNNYISVESVTGDNSSFRILNNEEINDMWALKKIEAAAIKVLIIDERLYDNNVYFIKNPLTKAQKETIKNALGVYFNNPDEIFKNFNYDIPESEYISIINSLEEENFDSSEWDYSDVKESYESINEDNVVLTIKNVFANRITHKHNIDKTLLNRLRNIKIATVNKNTIFDDFNKKIGIIKNINGKIQITRNDTDSYHYISIHQGILDKLFKLKVGETTLEQDEKILLSKRIINALQTTYNSKKVVIHTGRGKPNYIKGVAPYRSLSDLDYSLSEPKEIMINYFESASYEI